MSCKEIVFTFKLSSNTAVSTASFQLPAKGGFCWAANWGFSLLKTPCQSLGWQGLAGCLCHAGLHVPEALGWPCQPCHTGARSTRAERLKPGQGLAMSPSISERNHRILEAPVNVSLTLPASLSLSLFVCIYEIRWVWLSMYSVCMLCIYIYIIYLFIYLCIYLFIYLFIYLCVYLYTILCMCV